MEDAKGDVKDAVYYPEAAVRRLTDTISNWQWYPWESVTDPSTQVFVLVRHSCLVNRQLKLRCSMVLQVSRAVQ